MMQDIFKGYLLLFNKLSETEEALERLRQDLMAAQQQAEELYLAAGEDEESGCAGAGGGVQ